jgi:hypothetical protein
VTPPFKSDGKQVDRVPPRVHRRAEKVVRRQGMPLPEDMQPRR